MKNILLKLKRKKKRNIYKKEAFPYDMKAMTAYAEKRNIPLHTLTSAELSMFSLKKTLNNLQRYFSHSYAK